MIHADHIGAEVVDLPLRSDCEVHRVESSVNRDNAIFAHVTVGTVRVEVFDCKQVGTIRIVHRRADENA